MAEWRFITLQSMHGKVYFKSCVCTVFSIPKSTNKGPKSCHILKNDY